jgi:hypothetical protein
MTGADDREREELTAIEEKIARLRSKATPEKDERFWTDFTRNVRLDYDRRKKRTFVTRWFVLLPIAAATVLVAAFAFFGAVERRHTDPGTANAARELAFDPDAVVDERDLDDVLDSLNTEQLAKVAVALGVELDDKKGG